MRGEEARRRSRQFYLYSPLSKITNLLQETRQDRDNKERKKTRGDITASRKKDG